MTLPRRSQIALACTPYYHCIARCVRRAYLCGRDSYTNKNFDHRKQWLLDRLRRQAKVFAIDICAYAIMSNHYHLVVRVDLQRAQNWSDEEVMRRWTRLFRGPVLVQRKLQGTPLSPAETETVKEITSVWRKRLSDISWYMRCLNEHIARRANAEDECSGRFWEGRFKSQALIGEAALLACMAYVDLNPVRAGVANSLEASDFTSIQMRLWQLASARDGTDQNKPPFEVPLLLFDPRYKGKSERGGPLPFELTAYIRLVADTGRVPIHTTRSTSLEQSQSLVSQLSLSDQQWQTLTLEMHTRRLSVLGTPAELRSFAEATGRSRIHGMAALERHFGT